MKKLYPAIRLLNRSARTVIIIITALLCRQCLLAQPVITSFTPASGPPGTTVTISGSNFSTSPTGNTVYFGAAKAAVSGAGSTSLLVTVPTGATYQPVSVTANNLTAYSAQSFTVTFSGGGAILPGSFAKPTTITEGVWPAAMVESDLDGDGKSDLVVLNEGTHLVSILKNTSTGGTISFAPKIDYTPGFYPGSVSAGDLDGDGRPDLAMTNDTTISILRNTSTGGSISFVAATPYFTTNGPVSVVIRDIDGDGKPDLAVANSGTHVISIYRNTGTPGSVSFAPKVDFPVPNPTYVIAAGDLDGDGKIDLATADYLSNYVTVIRNTSTIGSISYSTATTYSVGNIPRSIYIGDLDGDGKADLATANTGSNSVSVLRNTGTAGYISFAANTNYTTGAGPISVSMIDLDGDGKPDLATANGNTNTVSVLKNTGTTGNISFAPKVDYTAGAAPYCIATGDLDGDSKPDLAIANYNPGTISLLRNRTNEPIITSFTPTAGYTGTSVLINGKNFTGTTAVYFGSINASSFTVITDTTISAVVNTGATGLVKVINTYGFDTLGLFTYTPVILPPPSILSFTPATGSTATVVAIHGRYFTGATAVAFGGIAATSFTVVNDSTITAVVDAGASGAVSVTTPYGPGTLGGFTYTIRPYTRVISFTPTTGGTGTTITIKGISFTNATAVRFGGKAASSFTIVSDTLINAIPGTGASGTVSVSGPFGSDSIPGFTFIPGMPAIQAPQIISFTPASGQGGTTVTITGNNFSPIADSNIVYFGAVKAVVSAATATSLTVTAPVGATHSPISVTTHQLTAYSRLPFIETFAGGGSAFTATSFATRGGYLTGSNPRSVAIIDLDVDGKPDLFVTNQVPGTASVFRNNSTGAILSFAAKQDIILGPDAFGLATGDFDGDGKKDIAVTNQNSGNASTVSILRNTSVPGNISFAPKADYATGSGSTGVSIADLDGDGKPDLVVTSGNSGIISIFKNTSTGPGNISFAAKSDLSASFHADAITIADLDGDGLPDIATANFSGNNISVRRNISSGGIITFAASTTYPAGTNPAGIAAGDLDGDGKPDLAVANYSSNNLSVFRNTSNSGTVSFSAKQDYPAPYLSRNIAMADLNGDGKTDIIIPADSPHVVSVFRNTSTTGTISIAPRQDYITGYSPPGLDLGDLDGDGQPDIAVANDFNFVSIFRNKINQPVLTGFAPRTATTGTTVSIYGAGFTGATAVSFGGIPASAFTVVSDTLITAIVGAGSTGSIRVRVAAAADSLGIFTFVAPAPKIYSFSPASGTTGTVVTISGAHLAAATNVSFGGTRAASFTVVNDSTVKAVVGTGKSGYVSVSTLYGVDTLAGFTYTPPPVPAPRVLYFTPDSATTGTVVTIFGTHLTGTTFVSFGGIQAGSFTVVTDSTIRATVGAGASGYVAVFTASGSDSLAGFSYFQGSQQAIAAYPNPARGYTVMKHPASTGSSQIEILNMQGTILKTIVLAPNAAATTRVDLTGLTRGIYKITWTDGKNTSALTLFIP